MSAVPEARRAGGALPVRLVRAAFWPALVVVLSLVVGALAVRISEYEMRWVVYLGAAVVLTGVTIVLTVPTTLLGSLVLGLSVDAHYYVTQPMPTMFVGNSGPTAISIPLSAIPALGILLRQAYLQYFGVSEFRWGPELGKPAVMVIATTFLATAVSSMRFLGFCVVALQIWLYVVYLAVMNAVRTREDLNLVVRLLLVVLFVQCMVFALQIVTGVKFSAVGQVSVDEAEGQSIWHQATGTAAITTAGFATFIEPLVMLAYALWRAGGPGTNRTWTILVAAVGAIVTVLTLNRSSWIGILVGLATVEVLLRARGLVPRYAVNWRMLAIVAGMACLFLLAMPLLAGKRNQDNYSDWIQRFDLMRPAIRMIMAHPVFGVGPGVYGYVLGSYAYALWQPWLFIVHNDYLLCWAERGTIGFIALLLFLRAAIRIARGASHSAEPALAVLGVGVFGGLVVHMWEVFWTQSMSFPVYGLLWMLLAILIAGRPLLEGAGAVTAAKAAA